MIVVLHSSLLGSEGAAEDLFTLQSGDPHLCLWSLLTSAPPPASPLSSSHLPPPLHTRSILWSFASKPSFSCRALHEPLGPGASHFQLKEVGMMKLTRLRCHVSRRSPVWSAALWGNVVDLQYTCSTGEYTKYTTFIQGAAAGLRADQRRMEGLENRAAQTSKLKLVPVILILVLVLMDWIILILEISGLEIKHGGRSLGSGLKGSLKSKFWSSPDRCQ